MKTFIVLIAVFAFTSANTINRAVGWGSNRPNPLINIDLAAAAAAAASGQASVNQALIETAIGSIDGPAYLQSLSGALASVSQDEEIGQIINVDKPSGNSTTINFADVQNLAIGQDTMFGYLGGSIGASLANSAASQTSGEGSPAEEAISQIYVVGKQN